MKYFNEFINFYSINIDNVINITDVFSDTTSESSDMTIDNTFV